MGLGALLTRNLVYQATNTLTGEQATYTVITDGRPGMYPDWSYGAYRGLLGIPAADAAMSLIAGLVGRVPWDGYRKVLGRRPVKLDPAPSILEAPTGSFEIPLRTWSAWCFDRLAHGNGVGLVASRSPDGWPTSYLPVDAEFAAVRRAGGADVPAGFAEGEIVWSINGRRYRASDVIHFKGPSKPGALRGMGVLENHFATLERSRKLDAQAGAVDSAAVPTGLLKSLNPDLTQAEATELKEAWTNAQRTRSVAVLNPSTEFEPIAWNPTEAQLLEARQYTIKEWANIFGVDPSFLGGENPSRVYANLEEKGLDLLRFGRPGEVISEFEQTLTMQLPRGQYVKANLDFTLRAATKTRYETHAIAIAAGFLTPDEVREYEDRDPLTAEQRAQIQQANAKLPAGPAGQQAGTPGTPSSPGQAQSPGQRVRAQLEVLDVDADWGDDLAWIDGIDVERARGFNPNQPRDSEGKFAETGAGDGSAFFSGHGGVQRLPSAGQKLGTGAKATVNPIQQSGATGRPATFKPAAAAPLPPRLAAAIADAKRQGLGRKPKSRAEVNRIAERLDVDPPPSSASRGWSGGQWAAYWATVSAGGDTEDGVKVADRVKGQVRALQPFDVEPAETDPVIGGDVDLSAALRDGETVHLADEDFTLDMLHIRAADVTGAKLRAYWTSGPGLAKWRGSRTPWRTLRKFLSKYLSGDKLDATTSSWYRIVFGTLPGQD